MSRVVSSFIAMGIYVLCEKTNSFSNLLPDTLKQTVSFHHVENAAAAVTPHPTKPHFTLSWGPGSTMAAAIQLLTVSWGSGSSMPAVIQELLH